MFTAVNNAAMDGVRFADAAVVAGEDNQRLLAELHFIERGDQFAHRFVEVGDVVGVEWILPLAFPLPLAVFLAVGRT